MNLEQMGSGATPSGKPEGDERDAHLSPSDIAEMEKTSRLGRALINELLFFKLGEEEKTGAFLAEILENSHDNGDYIELAHIEGSHKKILEILRGIVKLTKKEIRFTLNEGVRIILKPVGSVVSFERQDCVEAQYEGGTIYEAFDKSIELMQKDGKPVVAKTNFGPMLVFDPRRSSKETVVDNKWKCSMDNWRNIIDVFYELERFKIFFPGYLTVAELREKHTEDLLNFVENILADEKFWAKIPETLSDGGRGRESVNRDDLKKKLEQYLQKAQ